MELSTGTVVPSTIGPRVEQVGWGVARQVAHRLVEQVEEQPLLARLVDRAETPGWVAYAVFEGRDAVAVALLHLGAPGDGDGERASYDGDVVGPHAPPATREALLVRCLHDAAAAGARALTVPWSAHDGGGFLTGWPVMDEQ